MYDNQNYPWYLQQSPIFVTLYNGFFKVGEYMTPLPLGNMFDLDNISGTALFNLGMAWGLTGSPTYFDGLIYSIDDWSETKVWSGQPQDINNQIYRNFIKMNAYMFGKNYSLTLIKEAFEILLQGLGFSITVTEETMSFTINITASSGLLRILQEMQSYDSHFLGQLPGIKINFNYIANDE